MAAVAGAAKDAVINVDDEDDDESMDEEQLQEYREELESLGSFPDKVKINSLSMVAEDFADSPKNSEKIYQIIRNRLLATNSSPHNLLPVIYVLDSVLKNVKSNYIRLTQQDAATWMPVVYDKLRNNKPQQQKLEKVWRTWNDPLYALFDAASWKAMGRCFSSENNSSSSGSGKIGLAIGMPAVAGISRTKDGSLILPTGLRKEMQNILDDMQSDISNELEKVSLERLADINPDLLQNIKTAAEESTKTGATATGTSAASRGTSNGRSAGGATTKQQLPLPSFLVETRPENTLHIAQLWSEQPLLKESNSNDNDLLKQHTQDLIAKLQEHVTAVATSETTTTYTQQDALRMTEYLGVASATAHILTTELERLNTSNKPKPTPWHPTKVVVGPGMEFTPEGIKKKNPMAIGLLYEIGLPFVSSATGRRFRTQLELSKHLDALFKRKQLSKTMARTEERGWYVSEAVWTTGGNVEVATTDVLDASGDNATTTNGNDNDEPTTVLADDNRDRCVICGIRFKTFFDDNAGWKYSNCREMLVLNDDAAATESDDVLVHVTCWKGLGAPETLTSDQALQETLHHA